MRSFSAFQEGQPSDYPSDHWGTLQVSCHQAADSYHTLRERERERERERVSEREVKYTI